MARRPRTRRNSPTACTALFVGRVVLATCVLDVVVDADAIARESADVPHDESEQTPDETKASGDEEKDATGGPSLGAILAACVGVLFGAVIARWQIKRLQQMKQS